MSDEGKYDPKDLEKLIDESLDLSDKIQKMHSDVVQHVGYINEVLQSSKDIYLQLRDSGSEDFKELTISGTHFIRSLHDDLGSILQETGEIYSRVEFAANIMDTQSATTSTISYVNPFYISRLPEYEPNPILKKDKRETYVQKFAELDEHLGNTYKQIWEVYYTNTEPERSSLYQIRQTFDHFFSILAPDDEVRKSKFWTRKEGDKPNQIHRKERILFAANKHIKESHKKEYLISSANQLLETYGLLNQAHKRGKLDKKAAKKALFTMDRLLQNWVDAIDK